MSLRLAELNLGGGGGDEVSRSSEGVSKLAETLIPSAVSGLPEQRLTILASCYYIR
jgi:hypothetical protein